MKADSSYAKLNSSLILKEEKKESLVSEGVKAKPIKTIRKV